MSAGSEEVLPTDFGKYRLVKKIATGGMAEIFLAHARDTPSQPVVIKRILPHLGKSSEFVSMFFDEARIAAQLQHENIVQIYDIGQIGGAYYIVMEYVHGEDIRRIYNAAYKLQRSLPLSHSIRVIADAASGLAFAHNHVDFTGRPMGVVHRDVSPQNILVTYEGGVKVVDFGIAKAANKVNQTRAGVLKGKYSYMSPEQALGDAIDHRTDIFALGIILYETTTGTRLFKRHNELATLQAIIKCEMTPPSEALTGYPSELEEILMKTLARDPDDRFDDAQELSNALYHFLHESGLYVEREVIAEFMADLFQDRLALERGTGDLVIPHEDEYKEEMRDSTTAMREMRQGDDGTSPELSENVEIPATVLRPVPRANGALTSTRSDAPPPDMLPTVAAQPVYQGELDVQTQAPVQAVVIRATARSEASSVIEDPTLAQLDGPDLKARDGSAGRPREAPAQSLEDTAAIDDPERTTARNKKDKEPSLPRSAGASGSAKPASEPPSAPEPPPPRDRPAALGPPVSVERASPRSKIAEETERVRARNKAKADALTRPVPRGRRRTPTSTEIERSLAPRVAIAVGAVVAAILAGILASRLLSHMTERDEQPAAAAERYGRVTVLTEPGAAVFAGNELLGLATGQGVAGPFRVHAGEQEIRVAIEDVGFDRVRKLEIQAGRIHEFEIRGRKGFLRAQVQPWAKVKVDAHEVGITPLPNLPLLEGTHKVTLENPDIHRRFDTRVRIEPGGISELKVNLNSDGQPL